MASPSGFLAVSETYKLTAGHSGGTIGPVSSKRDLACSLLANRLFVSRHVRDRTGFRMECQWVRSRW
jgi:hypothetical protein